MHLYTYRLFKIGNLDIGTDFPGGVWSQEEFISSKKHGPIAARGSPKGSSCRNKAGARFLMNWCFSSAAHNDVEFWILVLPTTAEGSNRRRRMSFICNDGSFWHKMHCRLSAWHKLGKKKKWGGGVPLDNFHNFFFCLLFNKVKQVTAFPEGNHCKGFFWVGFFFSPWTEGLYCWYSMHLW